MALETLTSNTPETNCRPPKLDRLPTWRLVLHKDDRHTMDYVVETIVELTPLNPHVAVLRMLEAHQTGAASLISTHREHIELLHEQFGSKKLLTTIEPE